MSDTDTDDYNGWTNRETWATALHWSNNQGDYEWWLERGEELTRGDVEHHASGVSYCNQCRYKLVLMSDEDEEGNEIPDVHQCDAARGLLAREMEDALRELEEIVHHSPEEATEAGRMMLSDVGSVWRVDFDAVAESFLPENQ